MIPGYRASSRDSICRTTAESSTMSTLICFVSTVFGLSAVNITIPVVALFFKSQTKADGCSLGIDDDYPVRGNEFLPLFIGFYGALHRQSVVIFPTGRAKHASGYDIGDLFEGVLLVADNLHQIPHDAGHLLSLPGEFLAGAGRFLGGGGVGLCDLVHLGPANLDDQFTSASAMRPGTSRIRLVLPSPRIAPP